MTFYNNKMNYINKRKNESNNAIKQNQEIALMYLQKNRNLKNPNKKAKNPQEGNLPLDLGETVLINQGIMKIVIINISSIRNEQFLLRIIDVRLSLVNTGFPFFLN